MSLVDADLPERYRALLLAALDCVVTMDHAGHVVEWNPAAEHTFGWSAAEAAGREMAELIVPPSLRARHRDGLARYLAGGDRSCSTGGWRSPRCAATAASSRAS